MLHINIKAKTGFLTQTKDIMSIYPTRLIVMYAYSFKSFRHAYIEDKRSDMIGTPFSFFLSALDFMQMMVSSSSVVCHARSYGFTDRCCQGVF